MATVGPCLEALQDELEGLHADRLAMGYFAPPTPAQEQEANRIQAHLLDVIGTMLGTIQSEQIGLCVT